MKSKQCWKSCSRLVNTEDKKRECSRPEHKRRLSPEGFLGLQPVARHQYLTGYLCVSGFREVCQWQVCLQGESTQAKDSSKRQQRPVIPRTHLVGWRCVCAHVAMDGHSALANHSICESARIGFIVVFANVVCSTPLARILRYNEKVWSIG